MLSLYVSVKVYSSLCHVPIKTISLIFSHQFNSFTDRISITLFYLWQKLPIYLWQKLPLHVYYDAALPCEISGGHCEYWYFPFQKDGALAQDTQSSVEVTQDFILNAYCTA